MTDLHRPRRGIALLGSTGSIGTSCLEVVRCHADRFRTFALSANHSWTTLASQCQEFRPQYAVIADAGLKSVVERKQFPAETELLFGPEAIERIASDPAADVVVSAIVGAAGLHGTWAAVAAGKRVAVANKETLVVAGPLVMELAAQTGAELLPVDSEHSAIFQCLQAGRAAEVSRLILTASGGPFRNRRPEELEHVTVAEALAHPTWTMGRKITIDSATMMNKALELIEARWLFQIPASQLAVVIHPQSIVHSLVEFTDGSAIAQLSPPDMKLPIQYALSYPERWEGCGPRMNWSQALNLEFHPPDLDVFPALRLGFEVAERGGTCGAVLNAAKEVAVERFLAGELRFTEIVRACRSLLDHHHYESRPTLTEVLRLDRWAREETQRWKA